MEKAAVARFEAMTSTDRKAIKKTYHDDDIPAVVRIRQLPDARHRH
jgi:hypothetical protein